MIGFLRAFISIESGCISSGHNPCTFYGNETFRVSLSETESLVSLFSRAKDVGPQGVEARIVLTLAKSLIYLQKNENGGKGTRYCSLYFEPVVARLEN